MRGMTSFNSCCCDLSGPAVELTDLMTGTWTSTSTARTSTPAESAAESLSHAVSKTRQWVQKKILWNGSLSKALNNYPINWNILHSSYKKLSMNKFHLLKWHNCWLCFLIAEYSLSNLSKHLRHFETVVFTCSLLFLQEDVINTQCGYDVRDVRLKAVRSYGSRSLHTAHTACILLSLEFLFLLEPVSLRISRFCPVLLIDQNRTEPVLFHTLTDNSSAWLAASASVQINRRKIPLSSDI